jgi:hypothetical protein
MHMVMQLTAVCVNRINLILRLVTAAEMKHFAVMLASVVQSQQFEFERWWLAVQSSCIAYTSGTISCLSSIFELHLAYVLETALMQVGPF